MIKRMGKAYFISVKTNTMMVTGSMTIKMDMGNMLMNQVIVIKANGLMIRKMEKVKKNMLMDPNMMDIISMDRNKVRVDSNGQMVHFIMACGFKI